MNLVNLAGLSIMAIVLSADPSENKGKIEETKWTSLATEANGVKLPADSIVLEFKKDGKLVFTINGQEYLGKYILEEGKKITFEMDKPLGAQKTLQSNFTIAGKSLTMKDKDGKTITFKKVE